MANSVIQRSFAGGEIAPELYGRADQTKYQTGLRTCRNFQVRKSGGVANRIGSQFINEVKSSSLATYLIKFVFNDSQTYVIEVGNQYFRFYRSAARIVVSGVAAYNGATAYVVGDLVSSAGTNYYCIAATTGNAPPNASFWYALTGTVYEIPTPYVTADLSKLQFVQSGDTVTIVHPNYAPRNLTRTGHTTWKLETISFAPSISAPSGAPTITAPGAGATTWRYKVTAVKADSYEESLPTSAGSDTGDAASSSNVHTLSWSSVTGAAEYNVYMETPTDSGTYCYIGTAASTSFSNNGIDADTSITPPVSRNPFNATSDYPSTVSYYQQRRTFANTDNNIEKVWTSRSAMYNNLTISSPLQEDDAVTFTIAGRKVQEVRYLIEIGELVVLTAGGEWVVLGDQDGVLRANQPPNLKQIGHNGAAEVMPAIVNDSIVYVQARGAIVRDLKYEVSEEAGSTGYRGTDLTIFATHLFDGYTITRMDYAQTPHSTVWAVRSDGVLLGLTYLREHQLWGWHHHDTDGVYEDVCVVPEGDEDILYVVVRRTINGSTKRYIERFPSRRIDDIKLDATFADSWLTYDGRNTGSTTMTLSTAGGWTVSDEITVTASAGYFVSGDVGNAIVFLDGTDELVRINITEYTSSTIVKGYPNKTVPSAVRSVALTTWGKAVDELSGLSHIEGESVAVFGDGNVVASPNNEDYTTVTVSSGAITLARPYLIIHVGLPYVCDFETLDLDISGEQLRDRKKNISQVSVLLQESRGGFFGEEFPEDDSVDGLNELTTLIEDYDTPVPLTTGLAEISIASTWNQQGSFVIRQVDPLPMTILSSIPSGSIGG